jgi:hypothetical protein
MVRLPDECNRAQYSSLELCSRSRDEAGRTRLTRLPSTSRPAFSALGPPQGVHAAPPMPFHMLHDFPLLLMCAVSRGQLFTHQNLCNVGPSQVSAISSISSVTAVRPGEREGGREGGRERLVAAVCYRDISLAAFRSPSAPNLTPAHFMCLHSRRHSELPATAVAAAYVCGEGQAPPPQRRPSRIATGTPRPYGRGARAAGAAGPGVEAGRPGPTGAGREGGPEASGCRGPATRGCRGSGRAARVARRRRP